MYCRRERLCLDFYPDFLSLSEAEELYNLLDNLPPESWSRYSSTCRGNQTYGDDNISYTVKFGGYNGRPLKEVHRTAQPWSNTLLKIRNKITDLTGAPYNYCVVQRYPTCKVGIKPHRDKEMAPGTDIAGVSVGHQRTLTMIPPKYNQVNKVPVNIPLTSGSLYILKPPTNDHWQHCIREKSSMEPNSTRYSLTFRYTKSDF